MTQITWNIEDDWSRNRDSSGVTNDGLGSHTGRDTLDHGYEYGSLTRGLVAYYPFDGTVNDQTPIGNDGTDNTSAGYNGSGQVGSDSKDFDGSDDYVDIPSTNSLFSEYTVALWGKHDSPSDSDVDILIELRDNNGVMLRDKGDGTFYVEHYLSDGSNISLSTSVSSDTWTHWAATWDGSTVRLFKDGSQADSQNESSYGAKSQNATLGRDSKSGGNNFDGSLDDVRIYDRVLSQQEINKLSNITETQTVVEADVL